MGEDVIHLAHFMDGYPLCWPTVMHGAEFEGKPFEASNDEDVVTCVDCLKHLRE